MKAKKAVKRLDKVEAILSEVIDRYASIPEQTAGNRTLEDLGAARNSVVRAKAGVTKKLKSAAVKRKGVKAETASRSKTKQPSAKSA